MTESIDARVARVEEKLIAFIDNFEDHCHKEDVYAGDIKKNLADVSINLQKVIDKQNKQINYFAGISSAFVFIGGLVAWFFSK